MRPRTSRDGSSRLPPATRQFRRPAANGVRFGATPVRRLRGGNRRRDTVMGGIAPGSRQAAPAIPSVNRTASHRPCLRVANRAVQATYCETVEGSTRSERPGGRGNPEGARLRGRLTASCPGPVRPGGLRRCPLRKADSARPSRLSCQRGRDVSFRSCRERSAAATSRQGSRANAKTGRVAGHFAGNGAREDKAPDLPDHPSVEREIARLPVRRTTARTVERATADGPDTPRLGKESGLHASRRLP